MKKYDIYCYLIFNKFGNQNDIIYKSDREANKLKLYRFYGTFSDITFVCNFKIESIKDIQEFLMVNHI